MTRAIAILVLLAALYLMCRRLNARYIAEALAPAPAVYLPAQWKGELSVLVMAFAVVCLGVGALV